MYSTASRVSFATWRLGARGTLATLCLALLASPAAAEPITSILALAGGATIDFESPGDPIADSFAGHHLAAQYDPINDNIASFTSWIVGNADAPASGGHLHGALRIETTGAPWSAVGATGLLAMLNLGLEQPTVDLSITVFGQQGTILGSLTRTFHATPQNTALATLLQAFNDATQFVGFRSAVPIYAAEFTASGASPDLTANVTWDNLTLVVVPEPSTTWMLASAVLPLAIAATIARRHCRGR